MLIPAAHRLTASDGVHKTGHIATVAGYLHSTEVGEVNTNQRRDEERINEKYNSIDWGCNMLEGRDTTSRNYHGGTSTSEPAASCAGPYTDSYVLNLYRWQT